ncbi:MAG: ribosome silencing factor [Caldiserica bacterium]|nr:ribosome silencing factor [Caldisericota bacterium]
MDFQKLSRDIARLCWDKKGEDIVVINLEGISIICDYFVIVTGETEIHNRSVCDAVKEEIEGKQGILLHHIEGYEEGKWILMDFGGVLVHIFTQELREYYDLERLWGDAPQEKFTSLASGKEDRGSIKENIREA